MNANPKPCPACGAAPPPDSPQGLCPLCLLRDIAAESGSHATVPSQSPSPGPRGPAAPTRLHYFGDYELIDEIARGGMGIVYRARQVSLNRVVAVKMILSGRFASEEEVRRFRVEAEAAANLQHPGIVAIHEIGEHGGCHYFSMDFIAGENLAEHERRRAQSFPAPEAARLVQALAEAVHYAHQHGTLHRDLKPQNILIDAQGRPHITDFGLAKQWQRTAGDEAGRNASAVAASGLTRTGVVMGSPSYMAPEQAAARAGEIGPPTDVYSLGAILYQLLTGVPPHCGATPLETVNKVLGEEPSPPRRLQPGVPADLETICLKCLEKRPEHRYPTARQLEEELQRFVAGEPILARRAGLARRAWSWLVRHPWAVTGLISCVILALAITTYGLWEATRRLQWLNEHPGAALPDVWTMTRREISKWQWWGSAAAIAGALLIRLEYEIRKGAGAPIGTGRLAVYLASIVGSLFTIFYLLGKVVKISVWTEVPWQFGPVLVIFLPVFFAMTLLFLWQWLMEVQLCVSGASTVPDFLAVQRLPNLDGPFSYRRAYRAATAEGVARMRRQIGAMVPTLVGGGAVMAVALLVTGGGNPQGVLGALIGYMVAQCLLGTINPAWTAGGLVSEGKSGLARFGYATGGVMLAVYTAMLVSAHEAPMRLLGYAPIGLVGAAAAVIWRLRQARRTRG